MACFLDQGYHATKMQDVARQSGLAKGTLYLYFQSKEVLLLALLQRYFDDIRARIRMIPSPQTLDQFMMGLRLTMPADRLAATRLFFDVLGPGFQDPRAAEIIGVPLLVHEAPVRFDWLLGRALAFVAHCRAMGELPADGTSFGLETGELIRVSHEPAGVTLTLIERDGMMVLQPDRTAATSPGRAGGAAASGAGAGCAGAVEDEGAGVDVDGALPPIGDGAVLVGRPPKRGL